jgi:Tfp pilus assembly protein PilO
MNSPIDVRKLIRIATVLLSIVATSFVYFSFAPDVDAATMRVDQAQLQLDSDTSTASHLGMLREERSALASRYAHLFAQNPEAVFLRGLAADVARHGIALVSTAETRDVPSAATAPASTTPANDRTQLVIELRGSYRQLLAAIGELSLGPEIVRVDAPTLKRDGGSVIATIPVTIFEPAARATQDESTP